MRLDMPRNGSHPLQMRITNEHTAPAKGRFLDEQEHFMKNEEKLNKNKAALIFSTLNDKSNQYQTNLKYEFHEKLGEYYITIVDQETHKVVKEIPPKDMLDFYASMLEFAGLLVDERI